MQPAGPISTALETARAHFAACPSYRAFLGVSTADNAIAKTALGALPVPTDGSKYTAEQWEDELRPFGLIYTSSAGGYRTRRSALYASQESGHICVELEITVPTAYKATPESDPKDLTSDWEAADRWILNQIGQIVNEAIQRAGQPGYLDISQITVAMGPSREERNESVAAGHFYWTLLMVDWGGA